MRVDRLASVIMPIRNGGAFQGEVDWISRRGGVI